MNRMRRKQLDAILAKLEELKEEVAVLQEEEEEYRDNMPENLQGSEKYEKADAACDALSSTVDAIEEAVGYIEEAVGE